MTDGNHNSQDVVVFHHFPAMERGMTLAGYAAIITEYALSVPTPIFLCAIGLRHRRQEMENPSDKFR